MALLLASLKMVGSATGKRIIMLVDDLHSELDAEAQQRVYQRFEGLDLQLFISNIDTGLPQGFRAKDFKMFHVEHGTIRARNFG